MPDFNRDSVRNTLTVAISLSLVCSVLVAATAILLKPVQLRNEEEFRQRIILEVAGLMEDGANIASLYAAIEPRMVELESGEYVDSLAAGGDERMIDIPEQLDIAKIRQRSLYAPVFLVKSAGRVEQVILPVYGSGLWSTMYGYLSLAMDGNTVRGLRFYSHAETPGLGDQIDKPEWRAQWVGKQVYDENGEPRIEVIRGTVQDPESRYQIDALSGATLTGRGVTQLVRYWTGPHGFGPYLQRMQSSEGDAT